MPIKSFSDKAFAVKAQEHFEFEAKSLGKEISRLRRQWAVDKEHEDVCYDPIEGQSGNYPWASLSEGAVRAFEKGERTPQFATLLSLLSIYGSLSAGTLVVLFEKLLDDINGHVDYVNQVVEIEAAKKRANHETFTNRDIKANYPRRRGETIRGADGTSDKL